MIPASQLARAACFVALTFASGAGAAAENAPDSENGRYVLSPTADGILRLDTRTGAVSTCSNKGNGWACYAAPDERAALDAEVGRLLQENRRLKDALAQREGAVAGKLEDALPKEAPLPKQDALKPAPEAKSQNRVEIPLPSDRDIDRAMSVLEKVWRRLIEMVIRVQRDVSGKI